MVSFQGPWISVPSNLLRIPFASHRSHRAEAVAAAFGRGILAPFHNLVILRHPRCIHIERHFGDQRRTHKAILKQRKEEWTARTSASLLVSLLPKNELDSWLG